MGSRDEPCPLGWRDARCGRFGPCGCEPRAAAAAGQPTTAEQEAMQLEALSHGYLMDDISAAVAAGQPTTGGEADECPACGDPDCDGPSGRHQPIPAPPVTPDSGQLRDELMTIAAAWHSSLPASNLQSLADALLSGPVGRLLAERDEAHDNIERLTRLLDKAHREVSEVRAERDRYAAQVQAMRDAMVNGALMDSPAAIRRALDGYT